MFSLGTVTMLFGIGFIIYGSVENNIVGYSVGGVCLALSLFFYGIILIIVVKHKKQANNKIKELSLQFFDKKETSFERNYFNNSELSESRTEDEC